MWVRGKPLPPQQTSSCFTLVLSGYRRDTTGQKNGQWHDSMFQIEVPQQASRLYGEVFLLASVVK